MTVSEEDSSATGLLQLAFDALGFLVLGFAAFVFTEWRTLAQLRNGGHLIDYGQRRHSRRLCRWGRRRPPAASAC